MNKGGIYMFNRHFIHKKMGGTKRRGKEETARDTDENYLSDNLKDNLQQMRQEIGNSPDVVIREFKIGSLQVQVAVVFIDNMVDKKLVDDFVMRSLMVR
jgi:spore germination protein KA